MSWDVGVLGECATADQELEDANRNAPLNGHLLSHTLFSKIDMHRVRGRRNRPYLEVQLRLNTPDKPKFIDYVGAFAAAPNYVLCHSQHYGALFADRDANAPASSLNLMADLRLSGRAQLPRRVDFCSNDLTRNKLQDHCRFKNLQRGPIERAFHGTWHSGRVFLCPCRSPFIVLEWIPAFVHKPGPGDPECSQQTTSYSANPVVRRASPKAAARSDATANPAKCRPYRKPGCNSRSFAAAAFASSMRPSLASGAASVMYAILKPGLA